MAQNENEQYITVYSDENYVIWIDMDDQIVNVFFADNDLTMHFSYEDFGNFRRSINKLVWMDMNEQIDVFLAERGLTLHFSYGDFFIFREVVNGVEILPRFHTSWN